MRLEGWLRSMGWWPSFETPRKSAASQDEAPLLRAIFRPGWNIVRVRWNVDG
jgi:hypothetical protein